ncbi:hypothetical protein GW17_00014760 [Ensete ventricosum]|nr:hypothetical protein GW17_00014760 [Ensete ventricosum]
MYRGRTAPNFARTAAAAIGRVLHRQQLQRSPILDGKAQASPATTRCDPRSSPAKEEEKAEEEEKACGDRACYGELDSSMEDMASEKKAKKGKKRKASDDDEKSDTMFDSTDPTVAEKQAAAANGSALKKPKLMKDDDGDTDNTADDPNALSNFTISKVLRETEFEGD